MRALLIVGLLLNCATASAVERIQLTIGRLQSAAVEARDVTLDWQARGGTSVSADRVQLPQLPGTSLRVDGHCARLDTAAAPRCSGGRLHAADAALGELTARFDLQLERIDRWQLQLNDARATLSYNATDGRIATDQLKATLRATLSQNGRRTRFDATLQLPAGQAYVEPVFVDFGVQPATLKARGQYRSTGALQLDSVDWEQDGIGQLHLDGKLDTTAASQRHQLTLQLRSNHLDALLASYVQPALAGTPIQGLTAGGDAALDLTLLNGTVEKAALQLHARQLQLPGFNTELTGLRADAHWATDTATATPPTRLSWQSARLGRVPVGESQLDLQLGGRALRLLAPSRIPVLDGALRIDTLALDALGSPEVQANFAAAIEPIELPELCRALGWPEFSGQLSGELPGLKLRNRRIDVDGTLSATAFDGHIEVRKLQVIEPFSVLPRIAADIELRRLDLAAVTGAFDFGRIEGRLDGDIEGLRVVGWEPVAMNARLYSSPDDRSRHRISQRAIDSISSIGGGPTGLLSRGFMSFFEDFAYDRIGWRCALDNGVCRMSGIKPGPDGRGYVLVKGKGLPRIDVVGYSTQVNWRTFMAQLKGLGSSGPAQVR
ncbi:hypothetical protein E4T66_11355 [Sinimarinibacterium sp. CAU 1509]|uniref:hypothetical protein n=1 Tax=Sinimarinibacterium sp. CAU 1509 TaxID=2562283 RepID=UPI0010AD38D9|nr:hypothetical protein [Sinimarinibacterium sp. CAU 1509]TJY59777.1 hypothetical protein E4T66_11355 [Sinimarinibacterium sp. CAU 1509]